MNAAKEEQMNPEKEPYAYFQPGEIIFFISQERNQPINPEARDPETNQLIYKRRKDPDDREDGNTSDDEKSYERNGVLGVYIGEFPDMKYRLEQYPLLLRPIMWIILTLKWGNCIRPSNNIDWAWW
jgi:hypothetical protein